MSKEFAELEDKARRLPVQERAQLVHNLLTSLDTGEDIDAEKVWLDEAERRYQEFREGKLTVKAASKVYGEARAKLE